MKVRARSVALFFLLDWLWRRQKLNNLHLLQEVVIDARAHMMGRLASVVAKQALAGHHVVRALVKQRHALYCCYPLRLCTGLCE